MSDKWRGIWGMVTCFLAGVGVGSPLPPVVGPCALIVAIIISVAVGRSKRANERKLFAEVVMDSKTTTAPHSFRQLTPWDIGPNGRCRHCFLPCNAHPIHYWAPARPVGDRRPASMSWEALGGKET